MAIFKYSGKVPDCKDWLNMCVSGSAMKWIISFKSEVLILSWPLDFEEFNDLAILMISFWFVGF